MGLLAETVQLVDEVISIFFELLTVDFFELDILDLGLVALIPFLLEVPYILEVLYFLVNVVKVGRRGVADLEHLEPEYHVVPSISQPFHEVIVLIEVSKCGLVAVG